MTRALHAAFRVLAAAAAFYFVALAVNWWLR